VYDLKHDIAPFVAVFQEIWYVAFMGEHFVSSFFTSEGRGRRKPFFSIPPENRTSGSTSHLFEG